MKQARKLLVEQFVDRLGPSLNSLPKAEFRALPWQPSAPGDSSTWIAAGQPIAINASFGSGTKELVSGGRWYVRLLPTEFDPAALDNGAYATPAGSYGGSSGGDTTGGRITYFGSVLADSAEKQLAGATMWFRNTGEVWAMHSGISADFKGRSCFVGDYVPEQWAETLWYGLNSLSRDGGKGPFHVRLGVTGLTGLHWDIGNIFRGGPPMALEPAMELEFTVAGFDHDDWKPDFIRAWVELRRIFSLPAPNELEAQKILSKCR